MQICYSTKDGRVAAMGGGLCGGCATNHKNGEFYEPPYLFAADGTAAPRPLITQAPATTVVNDTMNVTGSDDVTAFNLVRLVAVTHHHTTDQRFIPLNFTKTNSGTYSVELPSNPNVLVPGNYWLFALNDNGVPSIGHTVQVQVTEAQITSEPAIDPNAGVVDYQYYEGNWNALPDFDALNAVATGQSPYISLSPATSNDFFGLRFTGTMDLPGTGEYTFYVTSDDGSELFINDQLVVSNDGLHPAVEKSVTATITQGTQDFVVTYFEKTGGVALSVEVAGPQVNRQPLHNFLASRNTAPPATPAPPVDSSASLLTNSGFENSTTGWTACGGAAGIGVTNNAYEGSSALSLTGGACIYQSYPVTAGDEVMLDCHARAGTEGYASMTLAIQNAAFTSLSAQEIQIDTEDYASHTSTQVAAGGANNAVVTLYSDAAATFDRCVLNVNNASTNPPAPDPDPTPDPEPTPEPPASANLLFNPDFESGLADWFSCGATEAVPSTNASSGNGAVEMSGTSCLYQENTLTQTGTARVRCSAFSSDTRYTSMTLSFNNSAFETLASQEVEVTATSYTPVEISAAIPANAEYAAVTFYSEGAAHFDDCELVQIQ
ncbi:MAG: galactose oxidase-like domain-containing protein [Pseudomonadota bacterium]